MTELFSSDVTFVGDACTTVVSFFVDDVTGERVTEFSHPSLRTHGNDSGRFRTSDTELALQMARRISQEGR